ncbi:MAG: hypothetical protein ACI8P3_000960 [Saprospiraceae bacterium]|jgi:hypothetical protein
MNFLYLKTCLAFFILLFQFNFAYAQTLNKGDIAFIGYHEDATDQFTWIALTDIPGDEEIYFTDKGWNVTGNTWFSNTEAHMLYTAPMGGISCGTIIHINETSADAFTVTGGGSANIALNSWSLIGGDQVLAYRGGAGVEPASPFFIAGVHADYNSSDYNPTTTWNNGVSTINGTASMLPSGLTNLDNCISIHPAPGLEFDCTHYDGTLTGTSAALLSLINNPANWGANETNSGPLNITASAFPVPNVDCSLLPVELIQFTAQLKENKAFLKWETASETNNHGFDIEYSNDGIEWKKLGNVEGNGSTNASNTYFYYDKNLKPGINYYRLKQIDFDGKYGYSNIESVTFEAINSESLIYPNPMLSEKVTIVIPNEGTEMSIFDSNGRLMFFSKMTKGAQDISLAKFPTGMYFVKFINGKNVQIERLVINN